MPLRLDNLVLEEILVLLEGLSTGHPMLDLLVKLLFFILHLDSLFVQTVHFLIEFVDGLVFESVVAVLCVQLLNQRL